MSGLLGACGGGDPAGSGGGAGGFGGGGGGGGGATATCGPSNCTPEVSNSYQPAWSTGGCSAKAKDLLRAGWSFQVFDIDVVSDDKITGSLKVTLTEQDFVAGAFTLQPTGGLQSMSVTLRKR